MTARDRNTVAQVEKVVRHALTGIDLIVAEAGRTERAAVDALAEIEAVTGAPIAPGTTGAERVAQVHAAMAKAGRAVEEARERMAKVAAAIAAAPPTGPQ